MIWASWWVWAVFAAVLAIVEVLAPSYIALGFAAGAGVVALGLATGLAPGGLGGLLVVFAVASGVAWWGLRRLFGTPGSAQRFEDDIND